MNLNDIRKMAEALNEMKQLPENCDDKDVQMNPKKKKKRDNKNTESDDNDVQVQEEVEQIDELSRDKVRSYIRKAYNNSKDLEAEVEKPFKIKDMNKNIAAHRKLKKRSASIALAGKKAYDLDGKAKVPARESFIDLYKAKLVEAKQETAEKITGEPAQSQQGAKEVKQSCETSASPDKSKLDKVVKPTALDSEKAIADNKTKEKQSAAAAPKSVREALQMMQENERAKHNKGATAPEGLTDKESPASKQFMALHGRDIPTVSDIDDVVKKNKIEVDASLGRQAPPRHGDQRIGDLKADKGNK